MTQQKFNEIATGMLLENKVKAKFDFIKVNGFYYIIDTDKDKRVAFNGKVFRCKTTKRLAETLNTLRIMYKHKLLQNK